MSTIRLEKPRFLLIALLGAVIAITLFNQTQFSFSSFDFQLSLRLFTKGRTEIMVPPLGTISASTHVFPAKVTLVLNNINFGILQELFEKGIEQQQFLSEMQLKLNKFARIYALKIIILGILGSMGAVFLFRPAGIKPLLKSGLLGIAFAAIIIAGIYYSYDFNKFHNPEYYGALENAPWMIDILKENLSKIESLGQKIQTTAQNVDTLLKKLDQNDVAIDNTILKILHVSDIHNNPLAFQFIEQIVNSFGVDIIVDTGDITDFGTPLETILPERIETLGIPYLFVAGNHDSPQVINALNRLNNVVNLNNRIVNIKGVNFAGINDPASVSNNVIPPLQEKMSEYVIQLNDLLYSAKVAPDILAVHNPWLANRFIGRIPVILHGHTHQYDFKADKGSIVINAGTTGAAGIRGLAAAQEVPNSLVLLNYEQKQTNTEQQNWQLISMDTIKVYNIKSGFVVEHQEFIE